MKLSHHCRLLAAQRVGQCSDHFKVVTVTLCKRHLPTSSLAEGQVYLWTFRLLLERLSWLARDIDYDVSYTLAHVRRFKKQDLQAYESKLKHIPNCNVSWSHIRGGGSFSTPKQDERLQWADIAASATFQAFEPTKGFTEPRYLEEMTPATKPAD